MGERNIPEGTAGHCQPTSPHSKLAHEPHPLHPLPSPFLLHKTELDAHLDTLLTKAECGTAWTTFSDTIGTPAFGALPLANQTKVSARMRSGDSGKE